MSDETNGNPQPEPPTGSILISIDENRSPTFSTQGKLSTDEMLLMLEHVKVAVYAQVIENMLQSMAAEAIKKAATNIQVARPGQRFPPHRAS